MKIGIVTIIDNNNYGNRLQNYALQFKVNQLGGNAETLRNEAFSNTKNKFILRKIKNLNYKGTYSSNSARKLNFEKFNSNINFSKKKYTIFSCMNRFDNVIVGSDQVWNPKNNRLREFDLLKNVEPQKRIAYAASFGISVLNENEKNNVKNEIEKFKKISVREDAGKNIIEEISDRKDVQVLIDPTMLLNNDEWDNVSEKPKMLNAKKYILNYFLGDLSLKRKREIDRIAKENQCEVINILDKNSPFYECGPSEFLYLEKNAFLICTDSFHACVFAFLYARPFVVFEREGTDVNMNSRIETLIEKFNLKNRKFNGKFIDENFECNYEEPYEILREERKKADTFLKSALDVL